MKMANRGNIVPLRIPEEYIHEYRCWLSLKNRCSYDRFKKYYSLKGIVVCESWLCFENFISDMGKAPTEKHTVDRIENNKGYCKDNCRWATMKEQARNRSNNHIITAFGKSLTIAEWAENININQFTLRDRINRYEWNIEDALTTPSRPKRKNTKKTSSTEIKEL
jgi:hypothetical protein